LIHKTKKDIQSQQNKMMVSKRGKIVDT